MRHIDINWHDIHGKVLHKVITTMSVYSLDKIAVIFIKSLNIIPYDSFNTKLDMLG